MKRPKYLNKKTVVDGIEFDSAKESKVYLLLKSLEGEGAIQNLVLQPTWEIIPQLTEKYVKRLKTKDKECLRVLHRATHYSADFQFDANGQTFVVDVKISPQMIPKEFPLKVKLMYWQHGIKVHKIFKPNDIYTLIKPCTE